MASRHATIALRLRRKCRAEEARAMSWMAIRGVGMQGRILAILALLHLQSDEWLEEGEEVRRGLHKSNRGTKTYEGWRKREKGYLRVK